MLSLMPQSQVEAINWTAALEVEVSYNTDDLDVTAIAKKVEMCCYKVVIKVEVRRRVKDECHHWEAEETEKCHVKEERQCAEDKHQACKVEAQQ